MTDCMRVAVARFVAAGDATGLRLDCSSNVGGRGATRSVTGFGSFFRMKE
jgi:hypothetical protein